MAARVNTWRQNVWAPRAALAVLVALQLAVCVVWAAAKQGYFVDELWSYGLANGYFTPHIFATPEFGQEWLTSGAITSYVTVDPGQQFAFDSVVYNLSNDSHPPGYFLALHTVCSLFPGTFSKWFGIVPNFIFFAAAQVLLYRLGRHLWGSSRWLPLVPCVLWGVSAGAVSFVLLIRMYMLATVLVLALACLACRFLKAPRVSFGLGAAVFAVALAGFLCHYYILLVAFFITLAVVVVLALRRKWASALAFGCAVAAAVLAMAVVFPASLGNIFGSPYAQSGAQAAGLATFVHQVWGFVQAVAADLAFGQPAMLMAEVIVVLVAFIYLAAKRRSLSSETKAAFTGAATLFVATCAFFLLAAKVSPFQTSRYVCIVYPVWVACGTWAVSAAVVQGVAARASYGKMQHGLQAAGVAAVGLLVVAAFATNPTQVRFTYPQDAANLSTVASTQAHSAIYVSAGWYNVTDKLLDYQIIGRVWTTTSDPASIPAAFSQVSPQHDPILLVYIDETCTLEDARAAAVSAGYTTFTPLQNYTPHADGTTHTTPYLVR